MKLLDLTLPTPAENLACDEALLNQAEAGGGEILRFWEPREHFVVVGYANKVETEVDVEACAARKIQIFRRCSGGGTVLQGPGCLNYTLVLQIGKHPQLANISCTNRFIMERNCHAVQSALDGQVPEIAVRSHTDLAMGERKFSGNSQRRHRRAVLFHGTLLLGFDLPLVGELLRMPSRQPNYRGRRSHADFLANLNLPDARLKQVFAGAWNATEGEPDFPAEDTARLAEKYSTAEWNFKA
jgi:lipoate---protein ligase